MPLRINDITVPVTSHSFEQDESQGRELLLQCTAAKLGISKEDILNLSIRKKSLDARRKSRIVFHYQVEIEVSNEEQVLKHNQSHATKVNAQSLADPLEGLTCRQIHFRNPPVIIGSGPAGTFAALVLAAAGQPAIIVDRGEAVENRLRTVNKLRRDGKFDAESNYCFGEGGAGTFSDGKLTCGRNHPLVRYLFEKWVEFGAPADILYEAHPHIGTDFLMQIAKRTRTYLESMGTKFVFGKCLTDFRENPSPTARIQAIFDDGSKLETDHLILAIGHSARDTYKMLLGRNMAIEPKPFAMGARFEHPQELINKIQFGGGCELPSAEYKLAAQVGERGIWTFCMCPGGHLLPTNAQAEHLAINGMSYHARNSGFANAAVVVNVRREDFYRDHPLDGMYFQENIEKLAYTEGGGNYFVPAQRLEDFVAGRKSSGEMRSTYKPGITAARLDRILPDFITTSLKKALFDYNKKMQGFLGSEGLVVGVETKTSSPIVMPRDKGLRSVSHASIFPSGEGAGFAGGIVSASLDGVRVGRAVLEDALTNRLAESATRYP